ncbi:B3 domain-containing protein At5g24050-like [Carica papaya]|uniref:B3 domain-containing protein At5g24050-like n=1 Tax=Carica papaya TaxID=3649 RepID=UPI000B8D1A7E|nr:B3 domain-containing protein At5g24050-like [Carica papaya]
MRNIPSMEEVAEPKEKTMEDDENSFEFADFQAEGLPINLNWDRTEWLLAIGRLEGRRAKRKKRTGTRSLPLTLHPQPSSQPEKPITKTHSSCSGLRRKSRSPADDPEWTEQKKKTTREGSSEKRQPKADHSDDDEVIHDLPERFENLILGEMKGSEPVLVIQKKLKYTDIKRDASRLSIPLKQVKTEFLTPEEKISLNGNNKKSVVIIEPSLEVSNINFTRWEMKKDNGKSSFSYVFLTEWTNLRIRNNLREDDLIQIWSFRVQGTPSFALVRVSDN